MKVKFNLKTETIKLDDYEFTVKELSGKQYLDLAEASTTGKKMDMKRFLSYAVINSVYLDNELALEENDLEEIPGTVYEKLLECVLRVNNNFGQKN